MSTNNYEPMSYEQWLDDMGYDFNESKNNQQLESDYENYLFLDSFVKEYGSLDQLFDEIDDDDCIVAD